MIWCVRFLFVLFPCLLCKVEAEDLAEVSLKYQVEAVPTFILLKVRTLLVIVVNCWEVSICIVWVTVKLP